MDENEALQKFEKVYQASEARKLRVLPGRIRASGNPTTVLVEAELRQDNGASRLFVTPVGTLIGTGLLTRNGLGITQAGDDLFDELLMQLRRNSSGIQLLSTKDGRTMVAFEQRGRQGRTRPMLLLPWWSEDVVFQAKDMPAAR